MVYFDDRTGGVGEGGYAELLERVITFAVRRCQPIEDADFEVSVSFVSREEIRVLNKKYRKIDRETDVLSFPAENEIVLGDIVICFEKAVEQAREFGHSVERELAFLAVHSLLHLFGFDHETKGDEAVMFAIQEKILTEFGLVR